MIETGLIRQLDKYCQVSWVLPWGCVQLVRVTPLHPPGAGWRPYTGASSAVVVVFSVHSVPDCQRIFKTNMNTIEGPER